MSVWLLALSVALAAKPKPSPAPAPPPTPAPLSDAQRGEAFAAWATALAGGDRAGAAAALVAILDDPSRSELHGQAWGHLGQVFEQAGLELSAIGAYGRGLSMDAARNEGLVDEALALVEKTGEPGLVAEALGNNLGVKAEGELRNRLSLVAARYHLDRESYGPASAILRMGDSQAPGFEDVEMLRGVVLTAQDLHKDAVAPLLTAQAMGIRAGRDATWRNLAAMNVARAQYAVGNYGQSIAAYATVERESEYWLDAQFERAWAHFAGNDTNGALAMLHNHATPFFEDFYQPEADLLRAQSYFLMCKFSDAGSEMDGFVARYTPIREELDALSVTPADAYADVAAYRLGEPTRIPAYLLRPLRHEERYDRAERSMRLAEDELQRVGALPGRAADLARELVTQQRDARLEVEGRRILARVSYAREQLGMMLEGIEITRLDLLALETQMYERAAATGVLDYGSTAKRLRDLKKAKKGYRVWPWEGEAWADELGWYVVSARPDCPESMARGVEGGSAP